MRQTLPCLFLNYDAFTFDQLVLLLDVCLEIKHEVVQLFYHEFALIEAFVCDVENRVFVSGFVVHVEYDMGFRYRRNFQNVFRFGLNSVLSDGDMHICRVSLERFHRAETS